MVGAASLVELGLLSCISLTSPSVLLIPCLPFFILLGHETRNLEATGSEYFGDCACLAP